MTLPYPIVLEAEDNGAASADVPGLPIYAAAESAAKAEPHSCRPDGIPGGASGQSTWRTDPRGALLRQGDDEG